MARQVFLSHAGIDIDAAARLRERLIERANADGGGRLRVWLDRADLRPGAPWAKQIEQAISQSHAFVVYVGATGIRNWVHAEVHAALNRAITEPDYVFIPVFEGPRDGQERELPYFARQFQGEFDVHNDIVGFERLLAAVLGDVPGGPSPTTRSPVFHSTPAIAVSIFVIGLVSREGRLNERDGTRGCLGTRRAVFQRQSSRSGLRGCAPHACWLGFRNLMGVWS